MSNTKIKSSQFHGVVGHGTDGYFLITNGDGSMSWISNIVNPVISSLSYPGSATAADPAGGETITITGTGFKTGATVTVGGTAAPSVSYVSATSLTITTPAKAAGDYDVVVTNTDGGTATSVNGISFNGIPSWTTAAGTLGTFASDTTISTITLQASEPDSGTITFSITNGALPTGLSLTGADIDGTTTLETADTLYTFTVTATDDETQTTPRTFTITVTKQFINTDNFTINTYTGNGSTQSIEGKIGTAASFNGSSSYIDTNYTLPADSSYSISCWFNTGDTSQMCIYSDIDSNADSPTSRISLRLLSSGNFGLIIGDGSSSWVNETTSSSSYLDGNWHHIVQVVNGTSIKLYADGNTTPIADLTSTVSAGTAGEGSIIFGRLGHYNGQYYNGKMDQVRVFNKALSSSEVTTLYGESNTSTTKSTTDIFNDGSGVALYEFEEGAKDTGASFGSLVTGSKIDLDVDGYTSGSVADLSGNSNTATVTGATYGTDPNGGGYFDLDGSSDYLQISSSTDFNSATNFTVEGWFKPDSLTTTDHFFCIYNISPATNRKFLLRLADADGDLEFVSYSSSGSAGNLETSNTSVRVVANKWNHIALSYQYSGTIEAFINGVSAGTSTSNGTMQTGGSGDLLIGALNGYIGSYDFDGKVGDVRFYDAALTSSQIVQNFNASKGEYGVGFDGTPTNVSFLGTSFQPDLVWIKNRFGYGHNHNLIDSARGASSKLFSNLTNAEASTGGLASFDSNGFSFDSSSGNDINEINFDFVAWCWKAGGTAVSNTDGTITSQVSANQDAGFSIATWSGDNTASNIGHGLGGSPELMIIKNRAGTNSWIVGVPDVLGTGYLTLNSSNQVSTSNVFGQVPDSTKYYFNTAAGGNGHLSTGNYVGYFFRSITGYQKVGSYSGSNSPISITTGFKPRFLLIKRTNASGNSWVIIDSAREIGSNANALFPDLSATTSSGWNTSFDSNGFTISSNESYVSASGGTYIYLAIA